MEMPSNKAVTCLENSPSFPKRAQVDQILSDRTEKCLDIVIDLMDQNICELCNKHFTHSSNLNRHVKNVHFGVKLECNICNKKYNRSDTLANHVKNAHSMEMRFECSTCFKKFYCAKQTNLDFNERNPIFRFCDHDKSIRHKILEDCTGQMNVPDNLNRKTYMYSKSELVSSFQDQLIDNEFHSFSDKENLISSVKEESNCITVHSNQDIKTKSEIKCFDQAELLQKKELGSFTIKKDLVERIMEIPISLNSKNNINNETKNLELCEQDKITRNKFVPDEKSGDDYKELKCMLCGKVFNQREDFLNHYHINEGSLKCCVCKFCKKRFNRFYSLKRHEKTHSMKVKHICNIIKCDRTSIDTKVNSSRAIFKPLDHNQTVFKDILKVKKFKCQICHRDFDRKGKLNVHLLRVHSNVEVEKPHACTICNKKFDRKSTLASHTLIHTGEKPHVCDICGHSTTSTGALNRHIRIHTGEKPYKCSVCDKSFGSKGNLNDHVRIHTREKPFICDVCNKAFWRRCLLNEHYIIHTGECPYKCEICDKVFKYSFKLKTHYLTHTKEKKFFCETCNKAFMTKFKLKEHNYEHTGERPYICDYGTCGKAFSKYNILTRHAIIHKGLQPYICDICKKGFNQKTSLTRHYVVHTKEKPYSCDICNQAFTQKSYLSIHKRKKNHN